MAVDAKALVGPLVKMYEDAMEIGDPKYRAITLTTKVADNIWGSVKGISDRDYPTCLKEHFGHQGPSFTIVFIPAKVMFLRWHSRTTRGMMSGAEKRSP